MFILLYYGAALDKIQWQVGSPSSKCHHFVDLVFLLQLGEENGIVCQGLLHRQVADVVTSEGCTTKWEGLSIVPLLRMESRSMA